MLQVFSVTLRGVFRDRVFQGILIIAVVFLLIPSISSLSMRQVTELSITLSLSLISFILLLLAVFLGGTSLWKDIERRYTFSVMGLPVTRASYVLGKFAGISCFVLLTSVVLGMAATAVIRYSSGIYPAMRPIVWSNIYLALLFDALKYILLVAFAFLFSTISTSFFLPVFGAISVFLVGSATQQVYDFIHTQAGQALPWYIKKIAPALYYVLPNFEAFDFKVNAIYGIALSVPGVFYTTGYFLIYLFLVLAFTSSIFSRRELQ